MLKNILVDDRLSDIYVRDGLIFAIKPAGEKTGVESFFEKSTAECWNGGEAETIDCSGRAALPAFVNMHTHAAMTLMRGIGEDILFQEWINKIWHVEADVDEEFVYWGTKIACLEMLRTGTATFNDHYWYPPEGYRAATEMGLRVMSSYVALDNNDEQETEREKEQILKMYEKSLKWADPSAFVAGFHAIYSVSEEMIVWVSEFAKKHGLHLHFHLSETEPEIVECRQKTGLSPVQYLDRLGVLDASCIAAHTLWLSDEDVEILGKHHVTCVHNINSNLKLASGYKFRYNELRDAGANVCIGTDGCASSNNMDMLEAVKTSAMVQKAWRKDPAAMPLDELIAMATSNGGKALGLNTGELREGMSADIMIVDVDNTFFLSPAPVLANFIYSAHSDCISSVLCKGRFLMKDKVIEGEQEILSEATKVLEKFKNR